MPDPTPTPKDQRATWEARRPGDEAMSDAIEVLLENATTYEEVAEEEAAFCRDAKPDGGRLSCGHRDAAECQSVVIELGLSARNLRAVARWLGER